MVSSGSVNSDLSSLKSYFSQYDSYISGLDGSWKGTSYDNIKSKANEFLSSFSSTLQSEMSAFASACDLYEQYKAKKGEIVTAKENYNRAVASNDNNNANIYSSQVNNLTSELNNLKSQIQSNLQTASSQVLEATTLNISDSILETSSQTGVSAITGPKVDWTNDENFAYFNQSGSWNEYRYSDGGSNTMGASGCGPTAMAMVLSSLGYDVDPNTTADWSADHGYHFPNIGTDEGYFPAYSEELGVNCNVLSRDKSNIQSALQDNDLVILRVGPGSYADFTNRGHFIVARGYDSSTDSVLIADPNRTENNTWWDLDRVMDQVKSDGDSVWAFSNT